MLFNRRVKQRLFDKVRNFVWPRSGLRRSSRYLAHRVRRIPGTPYAIAAGFASGAAMSVLPLPGFHFVLSGLMAWGLRASIIASAIGTIVGNPWTFPFIWLWTFRLGSWIMGGDGDLATHDISMSYLWEHPWRVLLPMVIGAIPTSIVTWLVFFWPIHRMVRRYQAIRHERLSQAAALRRAQQAVQQESAQ